MNIGENMKPDQKLYKLMFEFNKEKHPRVYKSWMKEEQKARDGKLLRFNSDGTVNTTYFDENLEIQTIDIKKLKQTFGFHDQVRKLVE